MFEFVIKTISLVYKYIFFHLISSHLISLHPTLHYTAHYITSRNSRLDVNLSKEYLVDDYEQIYNN
jgi:hypothetical protein